MNTTPLLQVTDLSVTFGGLNAVDHVTLDVEEGRVVGLIGPNGAGKTTFIDAVTGFVPISSGRVAFDGTPCDHLAPHRRALRGLARTFQSIELFEDLSVRENLLVSSERVHWWSVLRNLVRPGGVSHVDQVDWALDLLGLGTAAEKMPSELSHGQRKLVGVARSLAARPKLVLLDEPAAGLDSKESHVLGEHIRELPRHGITVFLIDHDMHLVLGVCDEVYVLEFGELIARGSPAEIRNDERVVAAYLGEQAREVLEGVDGAEVTR